MLRFPTPTVPQLRTLPTSRYARKSSRSNKAGASHTGVVRRSAPACNDASSVPCLLPADGRRLHRHCLVVRSEAAFIKSASEVISLLTFECTVLFFCGLNDTCRVKGPPTASPNIHGAIMLHLVANEGGGEGKDESEKLSSDPEGEDKVSFTRINLLTSLTVPLHCTLPPLPTPTPITSTVI